MIGHGRGTGGITFLNALFTGTGSAAGIDLDATATVELSPASGPPVVNAEPGSDTELVRATVVASLQRWAPAEAYSVRVRIDSRIPVAKGLKSSSGVGVAVARATSDALRRPVASEVAARLVADVGQRIGLSATGAFDDCLAAAEPGVHVTDNRRRQSVRSDPVDAQWSVVLAIPPGVHRPSAEYREAFQRDPASAAAAEDAARRGDFRAAMRRNSDLVERAMGYDYGPVRRRLDDAGAIASGVSGMGPALAVVVPPSAEAEARTILATLTDEVRTARFATAATPRGGP